MAARKPVQSFEPGSGSTDAEILAGATGEPVDSVMPGAPLLRSPVRTTDGGGLPRAPADT